MMRNNRNQHEGILIAIHQPLEPCPFCGHNEQEIYENDRAWPRNGDAGRALVEATMHCRCGASLYSRMVIEEGKDDVKQIVRHISDRWNERAEP